MGEGSLHPRPEGRGIRDPPHSQCIKRLIESVDTIDKETLSKMNLFAEFSSHLDHETLQTRFTL